MPKDNLSSYVSAVAGQMAVIIPDECEPGVRSNLELLFRHAAIVEAADDPMLDPAEDVRR